MASKERVIDVGFLSLPVEVQQELTDMAVERDLLARLQRAMYQRMEQLELLEVEKK